MATTPPSNLKVTGKGLAQIDASIRLLATVEVLVGVPEATTNNREDDGTGLTNAALAYIHDTGMPEQNIPARSFMRPALEENAEVIERSLVGIARRVLHGNPGAVEQGYQILGLKISSAIRNKIDDGVPPPLADRTLRARARKGRKGAQAELDRRAQGEVPGTDLAKPLVDTGEMRKSITYAIRLKNRS